MNMNFSKILGLLSVCLLLTSASLTAQMRGVWLPPNGDNQKSSISQWIGLVEANITYHSPNVINPYSGEDRTGKIWGELVPFGTENEDPNNVWRAGANANTILSISHDVFVEGQSLSAGKYGLFIIPTENEWTVIFSKEFRSWGAFAYDKSEDVLRIKVKPQKSEFNQWLSYEFVEKKSDASTFVLKWENLKLPIKISVPNAKDLYIESIRSDLKYGARWQSSSLIDAVYYCIENKINLEEALEWVERAISYKSIGVRTFRTHNAKSTVLNLLGREKESEIEFQTALAYLPKDPKAIYWEGRLRMIHGEDDKAMRVFKYNQKKFPKHTFEINLGLAQGYDALKDKKKAIKHLEVAIKHLPKDKENIRHIYTNWLDKLKNKII